jgi:lysophospholipase L1-like esterase
MDVDKDTKTALDVGRKQARQALRAQAAANKLRARAVKKLAKPVRLRIQAIGPAAEAAAVPKAFVSAGVLVAEGDSWFDYPRHDILKNLEDNYGYDVEHVAHHGDPIETMAYGEGQLRDLTRLLEKLLRRGERPKAVLLSGGGNDIAGEEFGMLLNHADSAIAGLNNSVVDGVIDQRLRSAYITMLSAITEVCRADNGQPIPIVLHGYDYPVPDGRGFMGGWGPLPGPWLEPGFRRKGYKKLARRTELIRSLIDRFNAMIEYVVALAPFAHVHYVNLRGTLTTGSDYKDWWANELHPTEAGFDEITKKFAKTLATLP